VADPGLPALPAADDGDGTVIQLIYPNPEEFADGEDMSAWIGRMKARHAASECKYSEPP
jgi:hypothetical protein